MGLILGGLLGGPIAGRLIEKRGLKPLDTPETDLEFAEDLKSPADHSEVTVRGVLGTLLALGLCLFVGDTVNRLLFHYQIRLPGFLTALLTGMVITNLVDPLRINLKHYTIDVIGGVCLQLFLVMSLMSMDLLSLADSMLLLVVTMSLQAVVIYFYATQVVFRFMGSDYDAALITRGFVGLSLGATPLAMANMDAAATRHGPSLKALLVVPLVGAFFIDLLNAGVISIFIGWLS